MPDTIYAFANFLESVDDAIHAYTESSTQAAWDVALERKTGNVIPEISINTKPLDTMVSIAAGLSADAKEAADFYGTKEAVKYFGENPLTLGLNFFTKGFNTHISCSPLKEFANRVKNLMDDVSGGRKGEKDILAWINDPSTLVRYKRKINANKVDIYRNSKELLKGDAPTDSVIDQKMLDDVVRANLYKFASIYANSYKTKTDGGDLSELSFATGVKSIKSAVNDGYDRLNRYINASFESNIPNSLCMQIGYSAKLMYVELSKYLIASYLGFMSNMIHDVRVFVETKKKIREVIISNTMAKAQYATMEAAEDPKDLHVDTHSAMISDIIDDVIRDITTNDDNDEAYEQGRASDFNDKRANQLPVDILTMLAKNLKEAAKYYQDNHESVSSDLVVRRYELNNTQIWDVLKDPFNGNKYIDTISGRHNGLVFNLRALQKMLATVGNLIRLCYSNNNELVMLAKTVGNEDETILAVTSMIDKNLDMVNKTLPQLVIARTDKIYKIIFPGLNKFTLNVAVDNNNYYVDAFDVNHDFDKLHHDEKVLTLNHAGQQQFVESVATPKYSLDQCFYEDDNNGDGNQQQNTNQNQSNNNNNSGNNNQQNNQNNGGNNDQNSGKATGSTSPKITDNSAKDNQNTNTQNTSGDNNSGSNQKMTDRIKTFINGVIDKIKNFFNKDHAKEKNLKFVNDHKDYLLRRSYANVTLQDMVPYIPMNYVDCMKSMLQRGASLTADQMKNLSEEAMYAYIYSSTSFAKVKGDNVDQRFAQAIKIGTQPDQLVQYSNGDIKKMIQPMIDYVINYYSTIESQLDSLLNEVDKLDALNKYSGNGDNDRTEANKTLVPRAINAGIGSCINVARQRANDYMKVLSSLVPDSERNKQTDQNQNNNGNNNNQNGNTNQQ